MKFEALLEIQNMMNSEYDYRNDVPLHMMYN